MNAELTSREHEAVRRTASNWIARRDAGLRPEEELELAAWRSAHPAHAAALARGEKLWAELDRPRNAGASAQLNRDLALLDARARRRRARLAGAGVALAAVVGLATWTLRPPEFGLPTATKPIAMLVPERRVLADGTEVEFPAGAAITVDYGSADVRRVTLMQGEAHFRVAKNPQRPFVVRAAGVDVQAVGTAFSVQLAAAQVEVVVTEGRVAVEREVHAEPAAGTLVDAGQKLTVSVTPAADAPPPQAETLTPRELEQRLAWRATRMEFSDTPLSEVVAAVNRYAGERGGERFQIGDAALKGRRMSGIFRVDDADALIGILQQGFDIEAERVGGQTIRLRSRR